MRKVLIVLESEDLSLALQDALLHDYSVTICGDPEAAVELLRQQPDALVLDLFLPGLDGLTFLKRVGDFLPPTILVLTRYISTHILEELSDLGVDHVFIKPCSISAIVGKLAERLK